MNLLTFTFIFFFQSRTVTPERVRQTEMGRKLFFYHSDVYAQIPLVRSQRSSWELSKAVNVFYSGTLRPWVLSCDCDKYTTKYYIIIITRSHTDIGKHNHAHIYSTHCTHVSLTHRLWTWNSLTHGVRWFDAVKSDLRSQPYWSLEW